MQEHTMRKTDTVGEAAPTAHEASLLMGATMAISMIGIFLGIFFMFINIDTTIRVAAAILVGCVGFISFIRHSVYYRSDQIRMGWRQDHPEFQLEVGYANLALGIWALVAAALNWGLVCGVMLAIYATYLLCTLILHLTEAHAWEELHKTAHRSRAVRSVISTLFFVLVLFGFAAIAFAREGVLPFVQL
ncbi:MAG: hypothetical protein CVV30_12120 [Methanomicrobiales archaeon HGW-Methanomicrobiales-1]|jgi:hypothetical protein|nr:MAG: hypothetical protein CVV30_12120 [Methanomicrobiales archaeon HGW-Methanomicrobiales-1]